MKRARPCSAPLRKVCLAPPRRAGGRGDMPQGPCCTSAAAGAAGAAGILGFSGHLGFKLADQHTPLVRTGLQVGPLELAGRARLDLVAQWHGVMVVDDLQRLSGTQRIQATKNLHMAFTRLNGAHINHGRLGRKHGNKPFWALMEEKMSTGLWISKKLQPSFPSSRV